MIKHKEPKVTSKKICKMLFRLGTLLAAASMSVALYHSAMAGVKKTFMPVREDNVVAYLRDVQHHRQQAAFWALGGLGFLVVASLIDARSRK